MPPDSMLKRISTINKDQVWFDTLYSPETEFLTWPSLDYLGIDKRPSPHIWCRDQRRCGSHPLEAYLGEPGSSCNHTTAY